MTSATALVGRALTFVALASSWDPKEAVFKAAVLLVRKKMKKSFSWRLGCLF
jgi:hypothetical protein